MNKDITMWVEFERKKAGHYFHKIRSKKQDIHKSINHVVDVWNNGNTICPDSITIVKNKKQKI